MEFKLFVTHINGNHELYNDCVMSKISEMVDSMMDREIDKRARWWSYNSHTNVWTIRTSCSRKNYVEFITNVNKLYEGLCEADPTAF